MLKEPTDENRKIVEEICEQKILWNIIMKITDNGKTAKDSDSLRDLHQDLLLSFLYDEKLAGIYQDGHINYYISRCVLNNICSSSSRYYRQYLLPLVRNTEINDAILKHGGSTED